jgi:hypothetical protein
MNKNSSVVENIKRKGGFYICPIDSCNKEFSEKGNLTTHIRVHVNIIV